MDFQKVAILGGGLLGGSLALALTERFSQTPVSLWARRAETVEAAKLRGIDGATDDLAEAVRGADLVILSTPVGAMAAVLLAAQGAGLSPAALITDVGSVKAVPHRVLPPLLRNTGGRYIGSHPMAGSEQSGVAAADANLFEGAACLLTDDEGVGQPWKGRLAGFWESLGCVVFPADSMPWMDAESHDRSVARVSHFPHMMAAATAIVALEDPVESVFAGGGLRDTIRVAGGDPDMWAEIAMENREALMPAMRRGIDVMRELLELLEAGDQEPVRQWLARAKDAREQAMGYSEIFKS